MRIINVVETFILVPRDCCTCSCCLCDCPLLLLLLDPYSCLYLGSRALCEEDMLGINGILSDVVTLEILGVVTLEIGLVTSDKLDGDCCIILDKVSVSLPWDNVLPCDGARARFLRVCCRGVVSSAVMAHVSGDLVEILRENMRHELYMSKTLNYN